MKKKGIRGMIEKLNEPNNFISGIYNYCDGWCERCSYTDRCLNYSSRDEYGFNNEDDEGTLDNTLDSVFEIFSDISAFLKEEAEKSGIDLNEEVDMSDYENAKEKAYSHPLTKKTYKYFQLVNDWFKSRKEIVTQQTDEFIKFAELGFDEEKIQSNVNEFQDAIEVIQWYYTLIRVKIIRALHTKFDKSYVDEEFTFEQVNTSAKIALVGCEKSLAAWKTLYEYLKEDEDKILTILAYLDKLIKSIKEEFPDVAEYKRPYFD
ncbi:MAG TPA: hypothetical protein ENN33_09515 [Ignavibacteria bacterium]|nr:hypothetical protein [Ignavibacteria bacterium]